MKQETTLPQETSSPRRVWDGLNLQRWYRPTFSPQHGVYVILAVAYLTGAIASGTWNDATGLGFICAFLGFQAEYPISQQVIQRKTLKLRLLLWGGLYGSIALAIAFYLYLQAPILVWLYAGIVAAFIADAIAISLRQQRSIWNEAIVFTAVCLACPLAYMATTQTFTLAVLGLWLLDALFFCSAIFTVKLRKPKTASLMPASIYHAIATLAAIALWFCGWISLPIALAFGIRLLEFGAIIVRLDWYRRTKIQNVAILETNVAILFLLVVAISSAIAS
ncbi:MAG: YwiC-like family protein [Cyanobacteria bacterium P01_E01_bin.42]